MLYDIIASVKNKRILNRKKHVYEKNLLNDNRAVRKYNMEVAVLKKLVTVLGAFFAVLLACPLSVFAAEGSKAPSTVPVWLCIPFAGLLLCIAVMPLVKAEWWESHQPLVVALWIILMVVPFAFVYGAGKTAETVLDCIVNDYLTFIILLFGLFCVSGNITMEGDFAGSPRVNVGLLALGTLLASCLTPIGDPPLLMGFMRGVPFFWSLNLFPVLIFNMVILLFVFYQIDKRSYRKDIANGRKPDIRKPGTQFRLDGLHNIIFLVMIVGAVILSGVLPGMSAFQDAAGNVRGIHLFGEVTLTFPALIEIVIILLAAFLSFKTTDKQIRIRNHFTWGAIQEVAVLFIGIFITMQPALMLLKAVGPNLGVTEPAEMFWATGALSSFLDNTPTYLVFLTTAGTLAFTNGITTTLGTVPTKILSAISCGAVFMGANTYIGNAPNFMVKAISDENGVKMPSFFGYMLWSVVFLVPVFIIDMFVFFL